MTESAAARKWKVGLTTYLVAIAFCNLVLVVQTVPKLRNGYQDFVLYYAAGKNVRAGHLQLLYNLADQFRTQLTFANAPIRHGALPFNHPPFEALVFVPLTLLRFWPAYLVWTGLNLAMLAAVVILLRRYPAIRSVHPLLSALALLAFFPLINALLQGQDVIFFLLAAVMALVCLERRADVAAGMWLGAGLYRPHFAIPLMLLLAVRRWRVLLGFVPVGLVLFVISVVMMGWGGPATYVRFVFLVERLKVGNFGPQVIPNVRGIVGMALANFPKPVIGATILVLSIVIFAVAARRIARGKDSLVYCFCLATLTTILVCFHSLSYDLTLLIPVIFFFLGTSLDGQKKIGWAKALLLFILFLTPMYVYLNFATGEFFCFGFVILWMYGRLLATPEPAVEPA
jgi:hypothetical protein